jgi:flagellar motor switch protein FliG
MSMPNTIPGPLKVAILIHALGEPASTEMLKHMNENEQLLIHSHLEKIGTVTPDMIDSVIGEFEQMLQNPSADTDNRLAVCGGAEDGDMVTRKGASNLETLRSLDAERLFELIKEEHPQTLALVLVHVKPDVASAVMSMLDDELKVDVSLRIASMDKVIAGMIDEIDKVFADILKSPDSTVTHKTDGIDCLAEILNQSDDVSREQILEEIEDNDPHMAAIIKQKMFVFEDLIKVDDRGLQKVLRQVETRELSIALKGASEEVKAKVFRNMSQRASEMLAEEIDAVGAVRIKEVEDAQISITKVIQDLEKKGEVVVAGRGGEEYIA